MGLYACLPCLEKHELKPSGNFCAQGYGICEICLQDHVWRNFTWDVTRMGEPIEKQLADHKARITATSS